MKFYYTQNSPYARRPRLVLHETGLTDRIEEIDLTPRDQNDAVLFANGPGGKVPALMTDSGTFLVESLIICRYMDDKVGGVMVPKDPATGDKVLQVTGIATVLMDTLYFRSHEGRRDAAQQSATIKEKDAATCQRAYDALNDAAAGFADSVDLGTIATVAALGYADWRHPGDDWRGGRAALAGWFEKIMERPAMKLTAPVY
ncbi:MAG: glutathione S-transferase N-terminal domain-containing protein [Rhodospirillaceae bacterium]